MWGLGSLKGVERGRKQGTGNLTPLPPGMAGGAVVPAQIPDSEGEEG